MEDQNFTLMLGSLRLARGPPGATVEQKVRSSKSGPLCAVLLRKTH